MTITKKDITKKISKQVQLSKIVSDDILNKFIEIIKERSFNASKIIKIAGFGSFLLKETPKRIGRNPLYPEESYIISKRKKLVLLPSSKVRDFIN